MRHIILVCILLVMGCKNKLGERCEGNDDCEEQSCEETFFGKLCTTPCELDTDCDEGAICSEGACLLTCDDDEECAGGSVCSYWANVCVPRCSDEDCPGRCSEGYCT